MLEQDTHVSCFFFMQLKTDEELVPDESAPPLYPKLTIAIWTLAIALLLTPWASASTALLGGVLYAQFLRNPFPRMSDKVGKLCLKVGIVLLGFCQDFSALSEVGGLGMALAIASIGITLAVGMWAGKRLGMPFDLYYLISVGTAICGGSAIAAVAPSIRADNDKISVALGVVFLLNAVALFLFPWLGALLDLTHPQFGLWSGIAIHDTSSVVGAAVQVSDQALQIAVAVKLSRALWIIPISFASAFLFAKKDAQGKKKISIPYFILLYVAASVLTYYVPAVQQAIGGVAKLTANKAMLIALFFIGTALTRQLFNHIGLKPLVLGVGLWILISVLSLWAIIEMA